MQHNISVIGLGKLGAPLVGVLANVGHRVVGVDVNQIFVEKINAGVAPVVEPGLDNYIETNKACISATMDYQEAIAATDTTFIIVPTPSMESGFFSNAYVLSAIEKIAEAIAQKSTRHLIVITSTVMPGTMNRDVVPTLEKISGKKVGVDVGLCYSPHFIALGNVIHNMEYPDFILLGSSDAQSAQQLEAIYRSYSKNHPPIRHMNFINAELTKISVNSYITTKISFANMLSGLCDKLPGANVDVITDSMGLDKRIGRAYLKAGSAYGGPCFPRDNIAFNRFAKSIDVPSDIAYSADNINNHQIERVIAYLEQSEQHAVAVLGLSYKTNTSFAIVSFGVSLANRLAQLGYTVTGFDPEVTDINQTSLEHTKIFTTSLDACLTESTFIVLTSDCKQLYAQLEQYIIQNSQRHFIIVDCWHLCDNLQSLENCQVIAPGVGDTVLQQSKLMEV